MEEVLSPRVDLFDFPAIAAVLVPLLPYSPRLPRTTTSTSSTSSFFAVIIVVFVVVVGGISSGGMDRRDDLGVADVFAPAAESPVDVV